MKGHEPGHVEHNRFKMAMKLRIPAVQADEAVGGQAKLVQARNSSLLSTLVGICRK